MRGKYKTLAFLALFALVATSLLPALAFSPYFAACKKEFTCFAQPHPECKINNCLPRHQVVEVIGIKGEMAEVVCHDFNGVPSKAWLNMMDLKELQPGDWQQQCYVNNPDPKDRLNLRTSPSVNSPSKGLYYNGVAPVMIAPPKNGWVQVMIDAQTGYMQTRYLRMGLLREGEAPALPELTILKSPGLHLRQKPYAQSSNLGIFLKGDRVQVLGVVGDWIHVKASDGFLGFMQASGLEGDLPGGKR